MSLSEASAIQLGGQHYLICDTEDCERNCQFYCNVCDRQLCEQCRDKHKMSPDTSSHGIFPYETRQCQLQEETCNLHPTKNLDMLCRECTIPLCSRCCTMPKHQGHIFDSIEELYEKKISLCQNKIAKIRHRFLPTSQDLRRDIKTDAAVIRSVMENIRLSMRSEADSLIHLIHVATLDNMEKCQSVENKLLEMLKSQENTYDDYITYLENLDKQLRSYMPARNLEHLFSTNYEDLEIKPIPETTKPIHPRFSPRAISADDVHKLLGRLDLPSTEPEEK